MTEVYYRTLKKKYTAYTGLTLLTMLTHLHSEYRRLTSQDIDKIDKRMKIQIIGDTEFEYFVQQIEDRQEAVALQNTYTDIQIVTTAKNLIESTSFYTMDWREWNRTDKAQKTWVNFKVHFLQAFRENRDQSRQAQHAGYGQSSIKNSANTAMLVEITQDHSHALANLSTATKSDRTRVANMSKTIADFTLQLGQANTKLAEAQSSIAALTSKLAKTGTRPNRSTTSPTK